MDFPINPLLIPMLGIIFGTAMVVGIVAIVHLDPLTRPAPAGESAGCGPPSPPRGRGT
jgi:hypothetical protein